MKSSGLDNICAKKMLLAQVVAMQSISGCHSPQAVHHDSSVRHQVGRLSLRAERNAARAATLRVERSMPLHLAAKTWRVWQRRSIFAPPLTAAGLSGCAPRSSLLQFRLIRARCMLACITLGLCCCALCFIYLFICCGYRGRAVRMERFSRQSRSYSQSHAPYLSLIHI